ncbi:MAG TPA: WbqC family protein [bacterium]|nr:WbqC family protein [bacterium]HPN43226.1 WbqC family protein [bacterium]
MKVVILQPGYLPWCGFFEQMNWADIFVFYDDVQYTKNDWRNRNRVKGPNGPVWLTVPVTAHHSDMILDVKMPDKNTWAVKHIKTIQNFYSKAPFFNDYFPDIAGLIAGVYPRLLDLNVALIEYLNHCLGIKTQLFFSSQLAVSGERTQKLVDICVKLGASEYLSGSAAQDYLNLDLFAQKQITVHFQEYHHPVYPQLYGTFIPYLSVIDLLFNCGQESLEYISGRKNNGKMDVN